MLATFKTTPQRFWRWLTHSRRRFVTVTIVAGVVLIVAGWWAKRCLIDICVWRSGFVDSVPGLYLDGVNGDWTLRRLAWSLGYQNYGPKDTFIWSIERSSDGTKLEYHTHHSGALVVTRGTGHFVPASRPVSILDNGEVAFEWQGNSVCLPDGTERTYPGLALDDSGRYFCAGGQHQVDFEFVHDPILLYRVSEPNQPVAEVPCKGTIDGVATAPTRITVYGRDAGYEPYDAWCAIFDVERDAVCLRKTIRIPCPDLTDVRWVMVLDVSPWNGHAVVRATRWAWLTGPHKYYLFDFETENLTPIHGAGNAKALFLRQEAVEAPRGE